MTRAHEASSVDVSRYIVRNPQVCGGDPTVVGTRVPVQSIVVAYQQYGSLEGVQGAYPRLTPAAIEAALAYYDAHRAEIDRLIEENERAIESAD